MRDRKAWIPPLPAGVAHAMLALGATMMIGAAPVAAETGTPTPQLTDRAGDANVVSDGSGEAPGAVPVPTAGAGFADITAAWVSTDYKLVPAVRNGVKGKEKAPYGFSTHIRLAEAPRALGLGSSYVLRWRWNNCTYSTIVMLPGALPDSQRALFSENCAASGQRYYELAPPEISGTEVIARVPFGIDFAFYYLYPGAALADMDAYSAHSDPAVFYAMEAIDYAPSEGPLGYFELGSDLHPTFIPDGGGS